MSEQPKLSEEEKHVLARWNGEAAKSWWTELTDKDRDEFSKLEPRVLFQLGWCGARVQSAKAARAEAARKMHDHTDFPLDVTATAPAQQPGAKRPEVADGLRRCAGCSALLIDVDSNYCSECSPP